MNFIDIRHSCFQADQDLLQKLTGLLSKQELTTANKFRQPALRDRYIQVRGQLRTSLAEYLGVQPAALEFGIGTYGKPYLKQHPLYFNLSHSADRLVIAISNLENIGIDIEYTQPRTNLRALAQRCFSAGEFHLWQQLPLSQQHKLFYQLWTKKEAFVKAVGRGIVLGLSNCELNLPAAQTFASLPAEYSPPNAWQLIEFWPTDTICGALVAPTTQLMLTELT